MRYLVLCVTLTILFFINTVYSFKIESAKYDDPLTESVNFNIRQSFQLQCNVSEDKNSTGEVKWRKDEEPVKFSDRIKASKSGNTYKLSISHAKESDSGNYSCVIEDDKGAIKSERKIKALSNIKIKTPTNINVVEAEKLKIHCQVKGLPLPDLTWHFKNDTGEFPITESTDRILLEIDPERDLDNGYLIIEEVNMDDRGVYTCIATSKITNLELDRSDCMVRIKDKYAALWPFLGICAEVIILCAVIFVYEKKRNKTELEESDTDQSPDQKNTPDHGKDSNLRHRQ